MMRMDESTWFKKGLDKKKIWKNITWSKTRKKAYLYVVKPQSNFQGNIFGFEK